MIASCALSFLFSQISSLQCSREPSAANDKLQQTCVCALQFSAFQDGNSFNTQLRVGRNTQTITINRTRDHVTVEGAFSTTNITSTGTSACGVRPAGHFICALAILGTM